MLLARRTATPAFLTGSIVIAAGLVGCEIGLTNMGSDFEALENPSNGSTDDTGFSTNGDDQEDSGTREDGTENPEEVACTTSGFNTIMQQATQDNSDSSKPLFVYQAREEDMEPYTEFQIASFQASPYNGPTGPGQYSLTGSNYEDCSLCILIVSGCDSNYSCDQIFFADEGELNITRLSNQGGPFLAELSNAVLREVTLDPQTYRSTPIVGGETWCIDNLSISAGVRVVN